MYGPLNTPIPSYSASIAIARTVPFLLLVLLPPSKSNLTLHDCNQIKPEQYIWTIRVYYIFRHSVVYNHQRIWKHLICLELTAYLSNYTKDILIGVFRSKCIAIMVSKQWCHLWLNYICSAILSFSYITSTTTDIMSIH